MEQGSACSIIMSMYIVIFIEKSLAQEILDITLDHYCSPFINAEENGKRSIAV